MAGILSLWFVTRILSAEQFAGYSVAMSVMALAGYAAGLGIERAMLLRLGELAPEAGRLAGRTLMLRIAGVVAVLSAATSLTLVLVLAPTMAANGNFAAEWIAPLAPMVPATALTLVLVTWFQANHRVGASQLMAGVTDGSRSLSLGLILLFGLGAAAVPAAAVAAAGLPIAVLWLLARHRNTPAPGEFGIGDVVDGMQFLTLRISTMGLRNLDIIALGVLASAVETAQYAVASRFAAIINMGHIAFAPTYAPRARRHLATDDAKKAEREFHVVRIAGLVSALVTVILFLLVGRPILSFFGDFGAGYGPFVILMAGHLANVGFGMHGMHLAMTGELRMSTLNHVGSLVLFVVLLALLVPGWGPIGAALSFLVSTLAYDLAGTAILRARTELRGIDTILAVPLFTALAALLVVGLMPELSLLAASVLIAILGVIAIREAPLLTGLARDVLAMLRRA